MRPVQSAETISESIQAIRKVGKRIHTNLFSQQEELRLLCEQGRLFYRAYDEIIYLWKREDDFYRLYFISGGTEPLAATLNDVSAYDDITVVADIPGRQADVKPTAKLFLAADYRPQASFQRMARPKIDCCAALDDATVVSAVDKDVPIIHQMLCGTFDKYSEHLPSREEITGAVRTHGILVVQTDDKPAGFLYYERTGVTSLLRYWFVDAPYRGQRIGARLMHRFFYECRDTQRFMLWVNANNQEAITRYEHYGYASDNTFDEILIKRGASCPER